MIRLVAYSQDDTTAVDLDLFEDEKIALTLNVDDIRTVSDKIGSYSKDFDLPATKKNNKFFKSIHNIEVTSEYNAYRSTRAELYEDSALIYSGRLFLDELIQKEGEKYYTATLISNSPSLFSELEGKTFKDLDLSDLAHSYNEANIVASATSTGVTLNSGGTSTDVYYPLVDNGIYLSYSDVFNIKSTQNYTPFVSLKHIIDKIFEEANFEYVSDFFNTDYFKSIYMDSSVGGFVGDDGQTFGDVKQKLSVVQQPLTESFQPLILGDTIEDDDDLYNALTGVYTAPADNSVILVDGFIPIQFTYIGEEYQMALEKTISGVTTTEIIWNADAYEIGWQTNNAQGDPITNSAFFVINEQFTLPSAGDTFRLLVKQIGVFPISTPAFASIVNEAPYYIPNPLDLTLFTQDGTLDLDFNINTSVALDITTGMQTYRGEIDLTTFLRDIIKMFNLTLEDTEHAKEIRIEPFQDFIATGKRLDWTNKTDRSTYKRIFVETPNKIVFSFNNDSEDTLLSIYKEETGTDYGSITIYPTSDLAQTDEQIVKEVKLETISASAFATHNNNAILSIYKQDETVNNDGYFDKHPFENSIRLIFKNSTQYYGVSTDLDGIISFQSNYVSGTHYDANLSAINTDTNSLNFGYISQMFSTVEYTTPTNNLYNRFWNKYISERYSDKLRVVSVFVNLTPSDIHNFTFADTVLIDNLEYRVNKIEYSAGARSMSKVELYVI